MGKIRCIIWGIVAILPLFLVSCEIEDEYLPVKFTVHESCAMRGAPDKLTKMVVYSEQEFNAKFIYTVADNNNPIDFSSSFVVAVCGESSNVYRIIQITEVLKKDSVLYVKYEVKKMGDISYKMAPCALVSISKDYSGYDVAFYDVTGMD